MVTKEPEIGIDNQISGNRFIKYKIEECVITEDKDKDGNKIKVRIYVTTCRLCYIEFMDKDLVNARGKLFRHFIQKHGNIFLGEC